MPVTPTYPGVYIEEVRSSVRPIAGVSTSIGAFIGHFERGPQDRAVQLLSEADFEREFGGLNKNSVTSYAIHQFFRNGGTQAWVVRVLNTGVGATAGVALQSGGADIFSASAGRQIRDESINDPGTWGNRLRLDVDYDANDPANEFNLNVSEVRLVDGLEVPTRSETYRNLSMDPDALRAAIELVNEASTLVQLNRLSANNNFTRPAETGTVGLDASATGSDAVSNVADGDSLLVTVTTPAGVVVNGQAATIALPTPATTLAQVATALQTALRSAATAVPPDQAGFLSGATVEVVNNQLRVRAGRTGTPATLSFAEDGGTTAADFGLVGAGVVVNVQQYHLGGASLEQQGATTTGVDPAFPAEAPDASALEGTRLNKSGLYALEEVDLFNILCIPRAADLPAAETTAIYTAAINYCEERRAFLVVDLPETTDTVADAKNWLTDNAGLRHRNAAAYFPRLRVPDPLNEFRLRNVPASGTIAGLYARTDSERGVWKAPAGSESTLRNVPDLAVNLTDIENGQLNPEGLNSLRNFDTFGNVCWGARTLVGADKQASEWKYVPVRRFALFLEESLYRGTQWVVFEPNDEPLWAQIRLNINAFMQNLFRQGAFQGTSPKEAYLVKCDRETTTQADIDLGIVNILVGFAPLKPAEFVIIKIQQLAGQTQS